MIVENLFRDRKIRVLCCTSTLALGVNLPAHLVVIKGTSHWQGKGIGYAQMDSSQILQMMGRAGRPGQDDNGVAVIMTDEKHRQQYERLAQGSEVVESRLHEDLVTVLNAEINNRVIESIEDAANWIRGTFLFTRITKNPQKYGLGGQISNVAKHGRAAEGAVVSFLNEKLKAGLRELSEASLCDLDEDGIVVAPNKMGQIMSRSMLKLGLKNSRGLGGGRRANTRQQKAACQTICSPPTRRSSRRTCRWPPRRTCRSPTLT